SELLLLFNYVIFISIKIAFAVGSTMESHYSFQDQEQNHRYKSCNVLLLVKAIKPFCWSEFNKSMVELGWQKWCEWELVLSHYNILTMCMENGCGIAGCYYPNAIVQKMFLNVHEQYFSSCALEEEPLRDPPPGVLVTLTLLPISVIPILVYVVIWKSSIRD
uniref:Si:ch73-334d15.2 n=1 Tax=Electrophorus electricus TaxID=8005 RepID=A0A4W4FEV7_ELEEL